MYGICLIPDVLRVTQVPIVFGGIKRIGAIHVLSVSRFLTISAMQNLRNNNVGRVMKRIWTQVGLTEIASYNPVMS